MKMIYDPASGTTPSSSSYQSAHHSSSAESYQYLGFYFILTDVLI